MSLGLILTLYLAIFGMLLVLLLNHYPLMIGLYRMLLRVRLRLQYLKLKRLIRRLEVIFLTLTSCINSQLTMCSNNMREAQRSVAPQMGLMKRLLYRAFLSFLVIILKLMLIVWQQSLLFLIDRQQRPTTSLPHKKINPPTT